MFSASEVKAKKRSSKRITETLNNIGKDEADTGFGGHAQLPTWR